MPCGEYHGLVLILVCCTVCANPTFAVSSMTMLGGFCEAYLSSPTARKANQNAPDEKHGREKVQRLFLGVICMRSRQCPVAKKQRHNVCSLMQNVLFAVLIIKSVGQALKLKSICLYHLLNYHD